MVPQVTIGFNTKWANDLDDLGYPYCRIYTYDIISYRRHLKTVINHEHHLSA
jgi:hypothetical protein